MKLLQMEIDTYMMQQSPATQKVRRLTLDQAPWLPGSQLACV